MRQNAHFAEKSTTSHTKLHLLKAVKVTPLVFQILSVFQICEVFKIRHNIWL